MTAGSAEEIAGNVARLQEKIAAACARVGRDPSDVLLVAISKKKTPADIAQAAAAGLQHFGENRVEEAQEKIPEVRAAVTAPLVWHMVGHIQSRKARDVLRLFDMAHSVDSVKLAERLSRLATERDRTLDALVQINISGEAAKSGLQAVSWETDEAGRVRLWDEIGYILGLPGLRVRGLMTMAPIVADPEQTRPVFAGLAALRAALAESFDNPLPELSMGMTDDYAVAIEEGATMIRIGRAIFGERGQ
jgi:PLP dependent protein